MLVRPNQATQRIPGNSMQQVSQGNTTMPNSTQNKNQRREQWIQFGNMVHQNTPIAAT